MDKFAEVGAYEAKSHFPELLRKAKAGMAFRITNRGEHVADLVPPGTAQRWGRAQAAKRMRQFLETHTPVGEVDIKALMEEGRD
jgi:antitoxin (DNA-binding transcriptional repressor) of toxin-antitoxin stability system